MTHRILRTRHTPVHEVRAYGCHPTIVFVTVCTTQRRPILADSVAADTIVSTWRAADAWRVGRYVIMSDHVHIFCSPIDQRVPLGRWVQYWKALTSRRWPRSVERPLWQIGYWDTQLRSAESYEAKWEYVRSNPVRHGLVAQAADWPYQGELVCLPRD